ncbi:Scr1 family TA system antitoxin-like transcriptional regulator [Actinomadura madurae]|uniref:Scr1 family TA system antitoxin-like transcriptional regulator n=2 Tax=Actinomadura madurae TaxID=1993 RepID=UPI0020D23D64|nr:Scr1 family TA system antitoxin-like transcriptional regulator [Actinomadura madurae]MCP9952104.1 Scr1 family TA system antitoxin-like transcriptional regulator [Actinomadura madurae]MCP9968863.1 Scr1 family TA system antitoxin-like transcriptional regulator [Actinomadura madurae]MCP9981343.1 Scr1 family TA system antitoxin-like transcriptional regulator [Actinomadura madurae]
MAKQTPSVRMRRLGAQLRKLREERGLNLDQASNFLKISKSALNRMENAQVTTRAHEVNYILMMYGIEEDDGLRAAMIGLATAGRSREWIKRHADVLPSGPLARDFTRLEQDSRAIQTYQANLIPGLLQTKGYARAVMDSVPRPPGSDLRRALAFRMARQEVLTRPAPAMLDVVLGEAAIRQCLEGPDIMAEQLCYVAETMTRSNITVRVLPFSVQRNPGVDGAFTMLDVETGDFTVVVIDSLTSSICVEDDRDVRRYGKVFRELQTVACSPSESRRIIEHAAEETHALQQDPRS